MTKDSDYFSKKWQMNARRKGKYDNIAANVGKCVFCDLREKYFIIENKNTVLTVNIFPYIEGQLIVIPKRHVERFGDISQKELIEVHKIMKLGMKILDEELDISDFWWILRDGKASGKTVKHLHWNLIPYSDDLNTWHYQKISITPLDLAKRLRKRL